MQTEEDEHVRRRAYAIWEQQGRPDGQHEGHWRQAHAEMHGLEDAPGHGGRTPHHVAPGGRKADAP
jgi:hypothetical protein